jgi:hypothetical protein
MRQGAQKISEHFICPGLGDHAGLLIVEDHESYYNAITGHNYLSRQ